MDWQVRRFDSPWSVGHEDIERWPGGHSTIVPDGTQYVADGTSIHKEPANSMYSNHLRLLNLVM